MFETATKHPEQSSTNENIGIDENGNPVNMDKWYTMEDTQNNGVGLSQGYGSDQGRGYRGNIIEGKIEGEIPAYVKLAGSDKGFLKVTCLDSTFESLWELKETPKIPDTVVYMNGTFSQCGQLTKITNFPEELVQMSYTFWKCGKLEVIPRLPDKVEDMFGTFGGCNDLKTVPEIPEKVNDMSLTFSRCSSLTGDLVINAQNLQDYTGCFSGAATNTGTNLVLTGTSPYIDELIETKSGNSNISNGNISID